MNTAGKVAVLKALADASRLAVINALQARPHCVEELAERLGLSASTMSFHLGKLEKAGLLSKAKNQYYTVYSLRPEMLQATLGDLVQATPSEADLGQQRLLRYRTKVVRTFFRQGRLRQLPKQWKKRQIVLEEFLQDFSPGRGYAEPEVNETIAARYDDYCTIRRLLVDGGHMQRTAAVYRRIANEPQAKEPQKAEKEPQNMESRADIKRRYKEAEVRAGVYQIKNLVNGKILLHSSTNLHGPFNKHRFMLDIGSHKNAELQRDWKALGPDQFAFEVLEVVQKKDEEGFSVEDELTRLEKLWMERTQPLAPRGYNDSTHIRE